MKKILIVDDDENVIEVLSLYLEKENFVVTIARDGEQALDKARDKQPDLIILDIMMPKLDGLEVCKKLRKKNDVPILLLSARGEEIDRVLGLEVGADDYVTKPFSPREVVARVKAILKRTSGDKNDGNQSLNYPDFELNQLERKLTIKGQEIKLSPKEYELILILALHPKQVFSREKLYQRIWGEEHFGELRTVDVHINWLRDKIDLDYIKTVWGVGYKFEVDS